MHLSISMRVLGLLLMMFSSAMIPPLVIALVADDHTITAFLSAMAITFFSGFALWLPFRGARHELRIRDGFLITALFWTVLGIFGALPFALAESPHLTPAKAIFESISGLTATGATVIVGLDDLPQSILLYRQLLQWMGGIGIIVVAVAVLPMLGVGGMQLYRAETPGPSKDSKLTPRITGTAKALFSVYLSLTLACALAYYFAGMSAFDAICHAFSTVALAGFSTHDQSMGFFKSDTILFISSLFMTISAINFGLHYIAWRNRSLAVYRKDSETKFFLCVLGLIIAITATHLEFTSRLPTWDSFVHGLFHAISIVTTTGYSTKDYEAWPTFLPILLFLGSCMGGCVGSTGGGIKAMRLMLIYKQGVRELKQLVHPQAIIPLKVGNRRVEPTVVSAVWSFFAVYVTSYIFLLLALMGTGLDFTSAFSAVAASLNNLGIGLGQVSNNFSEISEPAMAIMSFGMLLGRLEIFTLLVLFTPAFWRP
jgi:trk system potassium uptake protein TrkH